MFNCGYSNRSVRHLMQDTVNDGLKRIHLPSTPYIPVLQCGDIRRGYPTNLVDLTDILRDTESVNVLVAGIRPAYQNTDQAEQAKEPCRRNRF